MATYITTTTVDDQIAAEYIHRATDPFVAPMVYAALMGEGDVIEELSFDGKAKVVVFPLRPNPTVKSGAIAQTTVDVTSSFSLSGVNVTIREYGKMREQVTGLAQLQSYNNLDGQVIEYVAGCAGLTFDDLFAAAAVAKTGTGSVATGADSTDWQVINPDSANKPGGYLDKDDIDTARIKIQGYADPFMDGLYRGIVHKNTVYSFTRAISSTGNDFQDYSLYRQAGVTYPAEYANSLIGVWCGILWKVTQSSQHVISAGADDGTDAYKSLIFGSGYLGGVFVPTSNLPANPSVRRIPISRYVEVRMKPDPNDIHGRNWIYTFYFVGGTVVRDYKRGFFWVHKVDYVQPGR